MNEEGGYLMPQTITTYERKPWWVFWRKQRTRTIDIAASLKAGHDVEVSR